MKAARIVQWFKNHIVIGTLLAVLILYLGYELLSQVLVYSRDAYITTDVIAVAPEVSGPLVTERAFKRHMTQEQGGGPPDTDVLRAARHNIRYHLSYIGWLVRTRDWLAGDRLSLADLAAAAHLSAADYLGEVPWNEDEATRNWYARVKSRPSFRTLLADTLAGIPPSKTYADLDF